LVNQGDIEVMGAPSPNRPKVEAITNGNTPLLLNTDYSVDQAFNYLFYISKSYLSNLPVSQEPYPLTFHFDNGTSDIMFVTVTDSADNIPPVTTVHLQGTLNNGWYYDNVGIGFSAADHSGVAKTEYSSDLGVTWSVYGQSFVIDKEGLNTLKYRSIDNVGNIEPLQSVTVSLDKTAPTIAFQGAGTYSVTQTVYVSCIAADALSGVAVDPCRGYLASGPAYQFELGEHVISVNAEDKAGNIASGRANFIITVTYNDLSQLTKQFLEGAGKSGYQGIANSLAAKLKNAEASRGNEAAKDNMLKAYMNEVKAQSGKALLSDHASILMRLAQAMQTR
jgi:hypothetical protein